MLASYRGYDTLGETTVIFTAAASVMLLIGRGRHARRGPLRAVARTRRAADGLFPP